MKKKVYVLYGGKSVEHEVSLLSGMAVMNGLDKTRYQVFPVYITQQGIFCLLPEIQEEIITVEALRCSTNQSVAGSIANFLSHLSEVAKEAVVFPVLHGTNGEDGTIQGFLEIIDVPYVGNGVLGSALGIDKFVAKRIFHTCGIPQGMYLGLHQYQWNNDRENWVKTIEGTLSYPMYVKPSRLGSSVGISRCIDRASLIQGIGEAFTYDAKIVIENEIVGREMQIAVIGNDISNCSRVGEFIQEKQFMDYNAKYVDGKLIPVIPARIDDSLEIAMQEAATKAYEALGCRGLARVDYFVTSDNQFYVNEVNTLPGFTKFSMFPALREKTDGTTYQELVNQLIQLGLTEYENKQHYRFSRN